MNSYIEGLIIDINENGKWIEAKIGNSENPNEVILIEKNIKIKENNGKIHDIYCNKNIEFKEGEYIYISINKTLNKNEIKEVFKNENEYKLNMQKEEILSVGEGFSFISFIISIALTFVFQPALKTIITKFMYIEPSANSQSDLITEKIFGIIGPDSAFFGMISYFMVFFTIYSITNTYLKINKINSKTNINKTIENKDFQDIKINEVAEKYSQSKNDSCKISLSKK